MNIRTPTYRIYVCALIFNVFNFLIMIDYLMHRINSTALPATDPDEKQSLHHQISKAPA